MFQTLKQALKVNLGTRSLRPFSILSIQDNGYFLVIKRMSVGNSNEAFLKLATNVYKIIKKNECL